jgi:hypothetical protein
MLAGENIAGDTHIRRKLIDLVESAVQMARQNAWSRKSSTTKSLAELSENS